MRPPKGAFPKARMAAVFAVLGIGVGLMLHCKDSDEDAVRVSRQAATQIMDAEHARAAAATAIMSAKATAWRVEREAETALFRAEAARAPARIVGSDDVQVVENGSAPKGQEIPNAVPVMFRVPAPVVERMQLDSSAIAGLETLVRWKDTVIVKQNLLIAADSLELMARSNEFNALLRVKQSRCGRRCGIVLGIGGLLAAAVTVEQMRRAIK
jgi:hypothetical protein